MTSTLNWKFLLAVLGYAVACKVLPYGLHALNAAGVPIDPQQSWYPWNFSPYWAVFALCGAVVSNRRAALALPMLSMLLSDGLITLVHGNLFLTPTDVIVQVWVYVSFALCGGLGILIRNRPHLLTGLGASLPGAVLFFLATNYAMWAYGHGAFYPETPAGLWACYVAGLPFFVRSLISTAVYAGLLFSPWGLGLAGVESKPRAMASAPQFEVAGN